MFVAKWWPSGEPPGTPDSGWTLDAELYDSRRSHHDDDDEDGIRMKIVGYLPTWRQAENFPYGDTNKYLGLTHVIISFLMLESSNIVDSSTRPRFDDKTVHDVQEVLVNVKVATQSLGVKVMVAVGGATDNAFLDLMTKIGSQTANNNYLLQQTGDIISQFVLENDLDGVDLDLECWWGCSKDGGNAADMGGRHRNDGAHPAGKGLTALAKQLRKLLPQKIISSAVFATSWYGNNYDPDMIDSLDWIGIMTYDLTGSWNQSPVGPHSALRVIRDQQVYESEQHGDWPASGSTNNRIQSVEESLWYWTNPYFVNWQGRGSNITTRQKILLGVATYGYDFAFSKVADDLSGEIPPGYKTLRYQDIMVTFPQESIDSNNGNIKVHGSTPHPSFTGISGNYPYEHNIYYETPRTAAEKMEFAKMAGCGGVIIWELTNDTTGPRSIIESISRKTGNARHDNG